MHLVSLIGFSAFIFVVTNLDDLLILLGLFSLQGEERVAPVGSGPRYPKRFIQVLLGQLLGMALLSLICLSVAYAAQVTIPLWIRWMGLVPFLYGLVLIGKSEIQNGLDPLQKSRFFKLNGNPLSWVGGVAFLTVSQGVDNFSVWIPFFSETPPSEWGIVVSVFLFMTVIWCGFAAFLVSRKTLGNPIRKYGRKIFPWVLILIGLQIFFQK